MKAKSKQTKSTLRLLDYRRKCEIQKEKRQVLQSQIAKDFVHTHNKIARKTERYPLTEKVLTGNPDDLQQLLSNEEILEINPLDYPEGLVLP